jgi:hypothetical protein
LMEMVYGARGSGGRLVEEEKAVGIDAR